MTSLDNIHFIDTPSQLDFLVGFLKESKWVALDTEFLRERTYFSKFCLLQIATDQITACVDPLALKCLDPLLDLLYSDDITKVFHSARQDLEIFYHLRGEVPSPIFDTQIAAPLLGYPDQIGYASLVSQMLGVQLTKSHTRTDWSQRPLMEDQICYAIDDVKYLTQLYRIIVEKLAGLRRLDWLTEDFDKLRDSDLYINAPEMAWNRIRSANKLKGARLSALQLLAKWREQTARQEDRPRTWLLKDECIFDIARMMPTSPQQLSSIRSIQQNVIAQYGEPIIRLVNDASHHPPSPIQHNAKPTSKATDEEALIDILFAFVRLQAAKESIAPSVLASRKDLEQLLNLPSDSKVLKGWRKKLIGERLLELLNGDRCIKIKDGIVSF